MSYRDPANTLHANHVQAERHAHTARCQDERLACRGLSMEQRYARLKLSSRILDSENYPDGEVDD